MYSQWLVDDGSRNTYARFYPSPELLAVVANNTNETYCRSQFLKRYPQNPYQAIVAFGRELVAALKNNRPLQPPDLPIDDRSSDLPDVQPLSLAAPTLASSNGSKPQ
jgi:hypothetical protein